MRYPHPEMHTRLRPPAGILGVLLAAMLAACSLGDDRVLVFDAPRVFLHQLFTSDAECAAAQAQGRNCQQELLLCPDGSGHIVLTDIVDPIRYANRGNVVVVRPTHFSRSLLFSLTAEDSLLVEALSGSRWLRARHLEANIGALSCR